jgi:hypothetical protein
MKNTSQDYGKSVFLLKDVLAGVFLDIATFFCDCIGAVLSTIHSFYAQVDVILAYSDL